MSLTTFNRYLIPRLQAEGHLGKYTGLYIRYMSRNRPMLHTSNIAFLEPSHTLFAGLGEDKRVWQFEQTIIAFSTDINIVRVLSYHDSYNSFIRKYTLQLIPLQATAFLSYLHLNECWYRPIYIRANSKRFHIEMNGHSSYSRKRRPLICCMLLSR